MGNEKPRKIRYSVTLTDTIAKRIDELIRAGFYLNRGELIRAGLRMVFEKYPLETPDPQPT